MSSEGKFGDVSIGISQFVIANSRHVLPKYNATPLDKLLHGFVKGIIESFEKVRLPNQIYHLPNIGQRHLDTPLFSFSSSPAKRPPPYPIF